MRKVIVFQHVANKILGTLNPIMKENGLRMRYVNFERDPQAAPSMERYNGLIVLGGNMGVYEAEKYTHIKTEIKLIEEALKKDIPILGICLGSQMLAQVLGATVRKHSEKEVGWCNISLTSEGLVDPLFKHFKSTEKIFQLHGDTFNLPQSTTHLAYSDICPAQAFRYGTKVYGLQFHLEVDSAMIHRWMENPHNQQEIFSGNNSSPEQIRIDTEMHINHSMLLAHETFNQFVKLFTLKDRPVLTGSGHGKPTRNKRLIGL